MTNLTIPKRDLRKAAAAWVAVGQVTNGMKLGLGTGSTANWFVELLAYRIKQEGLSVQCVTTSTVTADLAGARGIDVVTLAEMPNPNLVVDGADEVNPALDLIKGGGGALLQEKIVARAAKRMIVIADDSKWVETLGVFHLPVEVVKFGANASQLEIESILGEHRIKSTHTEMRMKNGAPFITDEGHYIIDCHCGRIDDPAKLAVHLNQIPGVVENGLFIGLASQVIMGRDDGTVWVVDRDGGDLGLRDAALPADIRITE